MPSIYDIEQQEAFQSYSPEEQDSVRKAYRERYGYQDEWDKLSSSDLFQGYSPEDQDLVADAFDKKYETDLGSSFRKSRQPEDDRDNYLEKGLHKAKSSAEFSGEMATGDYQGAAENIAELNRYNAENPGSKEGSELMKAWEEGEGILGGAKNVIGEMSKDFRGAPGTWEGIKEVGKDVKAMAGGIVEQTPNMMAPMAGMVTGGLAGGAAGTAIPVVGNVLGAAAGAFAGASAGNTVVEGQGIAIQEMVKAGVDLNDIDAMASYLEENSSSLFGKSATKGAIIGAIDVATAGIANRVLTAPAKAVAARQLADMGVDLTSKTAVKTAMQSGEYASRVATDVAYQASKKGMGNLTRNATAAVLDPVGEGAGEYLGSGVSTGDWDSKNAAIEALSSIGTSAGMFAGQKTVQQATKPIEIMNAKNADEAIETFKKTMDSPPVSISPQQETPTVQPTNMVEAYDALEGDLLNDTASWLNKEAIDSFSPGFELTKAEARNIIEKKRAGLALTPSQEEKGKYIDKMANSYFTPQVKRTETIYDLPEGVNQTGMPEPVPPPTESGLLGINPDTIQEPVPYEDLPAFEPAVTPEVAPTPQETVKNEEIPVVQDVVQEPKKDILEASVERKPKEERAGLWEQYAAGKIEKDVDIQPTTEEKAEVEQVAETPVEKGETKTLTEEPTPVGKDAENVPKDISDTIARMEQELANADKSVQIIEGKDARIANETTVTSKTAPTTPEWFKQSTIKAYDKKNGTELAKKVSSASVKAVLKNVRSGKRLTDNQNNIWEYLQETARKEPDAGTGVKYDKYEKEGFDFKAPEETPVGSLKKGDEVIVLDKAGVPDKLTHRGRNKEGDIVLEDGVKMFVDEFDTIDVVGEKNDTIQQDTDQKGKPARSDGMAEQAEVEAVEKTDEKVKEDERKPSVDRNLSRIKYEDGEASVKPLDLGPGIKDSKAVQEKVAEISKKRRVMPIEITRDGFIVDGEHRYAAMLQLGVNDIPVFVGEQLGSSGRLVKSYPGISVEVNVPDIRKPVATNKKATKPVDAQIDADVGDKKEAEIFEAPAYHGTPHRGIEKFSTDKIGTGEGAQAFGYGLYYTDRKEIAEWYRDKLAGERVTKLKGKEVEKDTFLQANLNNLLGYKDFQKGKKETLEDMEWRLERETGDSKLELQEAIKTIKEVRLADIEQVKGQTYKVEIPEDDVLLHWDKPLSEQPKKVKKIIAENKDIYRKYMPETNDKARTGQDIYYGFENINEWEVAEKRGITRKEWRDNTTSEMAASKFLNSLGIKGIKYADGMSRNKGQDSFNYVIFDGSDVEVQETYYALEGKGVTAKTISKELEAVGIKNSISERDTEIVVSKIVIPEKSRGKGYGTKAMGKLIDYADRTGKTISLTPSTDFGGKSVAALKRFYKKLGFVENKGKNKDFEISESMYRSADKSKAGKEETTLGAVLKDVVNTEGPTQPLAKFLSDFIAKSKLNIKVIYDPSVRSAKYTAGNVNTITLRDMSMLNTSLHEITHAVTVREMMANDEVRGKVVGLMDKVKARLVKEGVYTQELIDEISSSKKSKTFKDKFGTGIQYSDLAYGLINEKEFLAQAVGSKQMQDTLKQIKITDKGKLRSAWDAFIDLVMKTLGIDATSKDALGEALSLVAQLAQQESVNEFAQPTSESLGDATSNIENLPAFKKWFKNSVVTDDNGNPLLVKHGTKAEVNKDFTFDYDKIGDNGRSEGAGFYFTTSDRVADGYGYGGEVISGYLNIEKPLEYDSPPFSEKDTRKIIKRIAEIEALEYEMDIEDGFLSNYGDARYDGIDSVVEEATAMIYDEDTALEQMGGMVGSGVDPQHVNRAVQEITGHDGVITNGFGGEDTGTQIFVAFFPSQFKAAQNTTWNPGKDGIFEESDSMFSGTEEAPILDEQTGKEKRYEKNFKQNTDIKEKILRNNNSIGRQIKGGLDKFLGSISTRLANIDEKLKFKLRRFEYDVGTISARYMKEVKPLLDKVNKGKGKMSKRDLVDWDYARKNSDKEKIDGLIKKYDLQKEYDRYREVLDKIRQEGLDVGYDIGLIDEYAPRVLKDAEGFLVEIGKHPQRAVITEKLRDRANELGILIGDMTPEMKADMVANMLFGGPMGKSAPGSTKVRKINQIPPEFNKYYMDSDSALTSHVHGMVSAVEARKFFGKTPIKISNAKRAKHATESRYRKNKNELKALYKENTPESREKARKIKKRNRDILGTIKEYQNVLDRFKTERNFDNTIGAYVADLVVNKKIDGGDEQALIDILSARFNEKGTHGLIQAYKNLSYIDTMGSPISALTQIGDQAWSLYDNGFISTIKHDAKSLVGKSRITKEDVGIDRIAQEFSDPGSLAKAVSTVFKAVGLEKMDAIGKETLLNGALEQYEKRAKTDEAKLRKELTPIFENEVDAVIDELQAKEITDNTKFLAYSKLLDFQPAAMSEMPEQYLRAGNGRIFYMLKTFTLKQFDIFRNISYNKIKNGNKKEKLEGIRNLIKMASLFVLANAGADELKDLVLGRKTDLNDRVVDNVLRLFGVSKYVAWQARTEGVGTAMAKQILPPFKFLNSLYKDVATVGDDKGVEMLGSIPVVGKLAYWHIGRGTSKRVDLWDGRLRKEKKRLNDIKDKVERDPTAIKRYNREIRRLKLANSLQGRLNKLRKKINETKALKESKSNKLKIQLLEKRRNDMIKNFLGSK